MASRPEPAARTHSHPPAKGPDPAQGLMAWINKRLPVQEFIDSQLKGYYAPKNFNIWYFFGSLALLVLVMQLLTGKGCAHGRYCSFVYNAPPPASLETASQA